MSILFYEMLIPIFVNFFGLCLALSPEGPYFCNASLLDRHPTHNIFSTHLHKLIKEPLYIGTQY
jgi:hypothetical protein